MLQPESTGSGGQCPLGSSCPEMPFSDGGTEAWRGGPRGRDCRGRVAGLGRVSVPAEAEAVFTPITCSCRPEVMGQAGQWLEGLPLRLAGGNSLFEPTRSRLHPPPPRPGDHSCSQQCVVCFLTLSSTPSKRKLCGGVLTVTLPNRQPCVAGLAPSLTEAVLGHLCTALGLSV